MFKKNETLYVWNSMYVCMCLRTYVPDSRLVNDMALDFQIGSVVSAMCLVRYELYPTTTWGTRTKCGIEG